MTEEVNSHFTKVNCSWEHKRHNEREIIHLYRINLVRQTDTWNRRRMWRGAKRRHIYTVGREK